MVLKIINPATEQIIRELEADTAVSLSAKFAQAKKAQLAFAQLPLSERIAMLTKFRKVVEDRSEEWAKITTAEIGKPIRQARNELKGFLARIDFFLQHIEAALKDEIVHREENLCERISYEPLGVIANISAWNYPYFVGGNVFVPALLTGNAVLYKPSEFSTLTGLAITAGLHEAGVPRDVFVAIVGGGEVGAELLKQPISGVFFTGSFATGAKVAEAAGRKLVRVQLELGGKDPIYVTDDVDVNAAAESTADGAMYNAGQSCCAVERIYVHHAIYEEFLAAFLKTVKSFTLGDPTLESTYIGPLTRSAQIAVIEHQIADAVSKGALVLWGGNRSTHRPGFFFEPTVLSNVNHSMEVMREESFGPIIGIQAVRSDEEALALMQDTQYGLTAGVYTRDQARAERLLRQVHVGSAYWNCCDRVSPRLPWSGRGHSGLGLTLSTQGIRAFTEPKAWHLRG